MSQMLLSINPEHVDNILSGKKQFEFRKVRCKSDINKIIIYSTAPVMRIVAEAEIEEIIEGDILTVWKLTKDYAGVSYNFYRKYYRGKKKAIAYKLGEVRPYAKPQKLSDIGISNAPQSFVYLPLVAH